MLQLFVLVPPDLIHLTYPITRISKVSLDSRGTYSILINANIKIRHDIYCTGNIASAQAYTTHYLEKEIIIYTKEAWAGLHISSWIFESKNIAYYSSSF